MRVKKVKILRDIELVNSIKIQLKLFSIHKNSIIHLCPKGRNRHFKKNEDFEVARTRKWGDCGSDEKLLWLAFLTSPISLFIFLSFLSIFLSISSSAFLSICLSVWLHYHIVLFLSMSICLIVYLSDYTIICFFVYISICLSV